MNRPPIPLDFARIAEGRPAATTRVGSLQKHFRRLPDPRVVGRTRHRLLDIAAIAIRAVIADADDRLEVAPFARKREARSRRLLRWPGGIPAPDAFGRVFAALDGRVVQRWCVAWRHEAATSMGLRHLAVDGKTRRGSGTATSAPLHGVSAWAAQAHLTSGQGAAGGKSNEITAIPPLLGMLDLPGALVSRDAMGRQEGIAQEVVAGGGDYVLAVKGNRGRLLEDIRATVGQALEGQWGAGVVRPHTPRFQGHGRSEGRPYLVIHAATGLRGQAAGPKLGPGGMCLGERAVGGETRAGVRYFIGGRRMGARQDAAVLRGHGGIESNSHWQLDISFGEDQSRIRDRRRAEPFGLLRKMALWLLKRHPSEEGIARKRKAAALDSAFLEEVIMGATKVEKA